MPPPQLYGSQTYAHKHAPGNHMDTLKNVVYIATVQAFQKLHPEGLVLVDAHSGPGVYDTIGADYAKGAGKCIEKNNGPRTPAPIKTFVSLLNKLTAEFGDGTVPGTALFTRELMGDNDVHKLTDLHVDDVEGLYEDALFHTMNAYDPAALDFYLNSSDTNKHTIILLDPPYEDESDWFETKDLIEAMLDRRPNVTIVLVLPLIKDEINRYNFPNALKELAKKKASVGRYYCSIVVSREGGLEGSAVLVVNPTKDLDETLNEECLEWLAQTMNEGKADYVVEQAMKKKKLIVRS
jgi:23S rRNA (adenine2030-N6)-methyltransferase